MNIKNFHGKPLISFSRLTLTVILLLLVLPWSVPGVEGERKWLNEMRLSSGPEVKGFSDTEVNGFGETVTVWMENEGGVIQIKGTVVTKDNLYLVFGRDVVFTRGNSYFPDIAIDKDNFVHLVWLEWVDNHLFLSYLKLNRYLTPVSEQKILSVKAYAKEPPSLGNAPEMVYDSLNTLHLSWAEKRRETTKQENDIYYLRLNNNGEPLTKITKISNSKGDSIFPDIAVNPQNPNETVVAWCNNATGNYEIYYSLLKINELEVDIKTRQLSFGSSSMALAPSVKFWKNDVIFLSWSEKDILQKDENEKYTKFKLKLAKLSPSGNFRQIVTVKDKKSSANGEESQPKEDALFPEIEVNNKNEIFLFWNSNRESKSNQLTDVILSTILNNVSSTSLYFEYLSMGHEFFSPSSAQQAEREPWKSFLSYIDPIIEAGTKFEEWDGYYMVLDTNLNTIENSKKISSTAEKSFFPSLSLNSHGLVHISFQNGDDDQIYFNGMSEEETEEKDVVFKGEEVFPFLLALGGAGVLLSFILSRGKDAFWGKGKSLFFLPLYTTISRNNVMKNKKRQEIYHVLSRKKGMTFSELMRELHMKNGVLAYHLALLEKNKYVKSIRDGKYRRFFLYEDEMPIFETIEKYILEVVKRNPRISHEELITKIHASKSKLNRKIQKLVHEGKLVAKYGDSTVHYYARTNLPYQKK